MPQINQRQLKRNTADPSALTNPKNSLGVPIDGNLSRSQSAPPTSPAANPTLSRAATSKASLTRRCPTENRPLSGPEALTSSQVLLQQRPSWTSPPAHQRSGPNLASKSRKEIIKACTAPRCLARAQRQSSLAADGHVACGGSIEAKFVTIPTPTALWEGALPAFKMTFAPGSPPPGPTARRTMFDDAQRARRRRAGDPAAAATAAADRWVTGARPPLAGPGR